MIKYLFVLIVIIQFFACKVDKKANEISKFLFSVDTITFKSKANNDTTKLTFTLLNKGLNPIRIINSSASCECTSISFDTAAIAQNKSSIISLIYKHRGFKFSGLKNVVVETNSSPKFSVIYLKEIAK
jgi:hypothetical protein